VSNAIQRLRFFDGEYVRAYDFTDEQSYHVDMRRRLNRRLHLHGIVYGLQIEQDDTSVPPAAIFYSIMPGMAIDQLGREIFVPAPYSLSSGDVLKQAGLHNGDYEVWLCYQETQTGLPAAGYRDCNSTDQHTRWRETYQVVLREINGSSGAASSGGASGCDGVCVGTITLTTGTGGWQISNPKPDGRTYVGIRAQRVVAADEEKDNIFSITAQNIDPTTRAILPGYVDVLPGVLERGNLIVEKNVVVGDDFTLDNPPHKLLPKKDKIPATGNVKVTGDLFVNGGVFLQDGDWFDLKSYIAAQMPLIVAGSQDVDLTPSAGLATGQIASGTDHVSVRIDAAHSAKAPQILISLSKMAWQDATTLKTDWGTSAVQFQVSVSGQAPLPPLPTSFDLDINWSIGPVFVTAGPGSTVLLPITSLVVDYMLIFQP
jgi:hypothetical protein